MQRIADALDVRIERPDELRDLLTARPNASEVKEQPEGMERIAGGGAWEPVWHDAVSRASI